MKELVYTREFENRGSIKNIFIPTGKEWKSTEAQSLSVVESGENKVFFSKIIKGIKSAKRMICLQSFLIQDSQIIDELLKAKRDKLVKIFIMDSAETRLNNTIEEENDFAVIDYKKLLVDKFKNNFSHRQANNLHAKFILIDPVTNPKGFMFTGNFTKKPFAKNPELGVELSKKQIKDFYKVFVYHFWEYTIDEQTQNNQFDKVKPAKRFTRPVLNEVLITSPDNKLSNLKEVLIESIKSAKKEISFSTFGFDINNQASQEILIKLKQGLKVNVFCRPRRKAIIGNIDLLAEHGAKIYCHPLIHAKSLLVDNEKAFIFSANFEQSGMESNLEVGVQLNIKQTSDLKEIYMNWKTTFPFKFVSNAFISETNIYYNLENGGKLEEQSIKEIEKKSNNKIVKNIDELISFLNDIKEPKEFASQKYIVERISKFQNIKEDYKIITKVTEGIGVIEYNKLFKKATKKKPEIRKNTKAILIEPSKINDVDKIIKVLELDYNSLEIFSE